MLSGLSFHPLFEKQSSLEASSLNHEQQITEVRRRIEEVRQRQIAEALEILRSLSDFQTEIGNREFRDLSKSSDQQKFPVVIGEIILSYLGDEAASVEGEFTLSGSIEFIKERDRSEINKKSKKFSDLIHQQTEQELKNKEIPENYKELLESIEKTVSFDIRLKDIKFLDLKKKIEFFLLLKDLSKERIEVLEKTCEDENLLEFFQEVFKWIKEYKETQRYPKIEIEKFIKLSVENGKEEMAIELAGKILDLSIKDWAFKSIIDALIKWEGNEKEERELYEIEKWVRYEQSIELASKVLDLEVRNWTFRCIINALLEWEGDEKQKIERCDKAIEWASKISDLNARDFIFSDIVDALFDKWEEKNDKEKNECYIKAKKAAYEISNRDIQYEVFARIRYYVPSMSCIII